MIEDQPKVEAAFRSGQGVAWGDGGGCLFCAVGAFFRPGYVNSIVQSWLPSLNGVLPKLKDGAKVADIGCGVGHSTLLMAKAFPASSFVGYDFHAPSIEQANMHAKAHGLADRVRFVTAQAKEIATATSTSSPCSTAARHGRSARLRQACAQAVEAERLLDDRRAHRGDDPAENVGNPVSRLYYNASTMICVPTSLAQEVGEALGAQAGEAKLTEVLKMAVSAMCGAPPKALQHRARSPAVGDLASGLGFNPGRERLFLVRSTPLAPFGEIRSRDRGPSEQFREHFRGAPWRRRLRRA